jgi:hypothetical protein
MKSAHRQLHGAAHRQPNRRVISLALVISSLVVWLGLELARG